MHAPRLSGGPQADGLRAREKTIFQALLVVAVDPVDAEDSTAFSHWYDNVQIPGFLRLAGTQRVTRYKASNVRVDPIVPAAQQYLVIYELELASADGLADYAERQHQAVLQKKIGRGSPGGSALRIDTAAGAYYQQVSGRVGEADVVPQSAIIFYSDPAPGIADEEFRRQSDRHLHHAVHELGFQYAAQYRITSLNEDRMPARWIVTNRYMTLYGLETKSESILKETCHALRRALESSCAAVVLSGARIQIYERIGQPRLASG